MQDVGCANIAQKVPWMPANSVHIRQSRLDSGLGFQVKVIFVSPVVPSWLDSGPEFKAHRRLYRSTLSSRVIK